MPIPSDDRPPIRIVTRGLAELQTSIVARGLPLFEGSIDRFAIFTLLFGQRVRAGSGDERPTSILAIASSLSKPFETVRRNVRKLEAQGLCRIGTAGVVVDRTTLDDPAVATLAVHVHDCLVRFVEELVALAAVPTLARGALPYRAEAGLLAASDLMLAVAETNEGMHETFADLVIFSAVLACNYRAITTTRGLARRIRNETHPAPPNLLRGARPSAVARTLGLSESTVRRRMVAMLGGPLTMRDHLFFVFKPWFNTDAAIATSRSSVARVSRVLGELALAGFPIGDPGSAYLGEPPPYASFA